MKRINLLFLFLLVTGVVILTGCKKQAVTPSVTETPQVIQPSTAPSAPTVSQVEQPFVPSKDRSSLRQEESLASPATELSQTTQEAAPLVPESPQVTQEAAAE